MQWALGGRSRRRLVLWLVLGLTGAVFVHGEPAVAAGTGSVRFEVVDAATGEPLAAEVYDIAPPFQMASFGVPSAPIDGLAVGEHTFIATHGRYGNDTSGMLFDGANQKWGESVVATVVEDVETLVRIEMTPPARVRFRAVSELDASPLSPLSLHSHPGPIDGLTHAVDGWYEVAVHPAPIQQTIWLDGASIPITHTLDPIPSGTTATLDEPLIVHVPPTIAGRVVDSTGTPLVGAQIQLAPHFIVDLTQFPSTTTDSLGNYFLTTTHTAYNVAAFPPSERTDLAAGAPGGMGLEGDRHVARVASTAPVGA